MDRSGSIQRSFSLRSLTSLRTGGKAERLAFCHSLEDCGAHATAAQREGEHPTILGWGSNILPSDQGVPGLTLVNRSSHIFMREDGSVVADCGALFQELFLFTAQRGLKGLEFAVGIPGSIGGALVSNAGAYRSNVSEFLTELVVATDGEVKTVSPEIMRFSYRDSVLRQEVSPSIVLLQAVFKLETGIPKVIWDEARDNQRQRIGKQPTPASAGSFFKNVTSISLAESLETLPPRMREAGIVPAGYLIEAVGLKGCRHRGAMMGERHANFMLNVGGATATSIRSLAQHVKRKVFDRFGFELEEEVLYLGDWSKFQPEIVGE